VGLVEALGRSQVTVNHSLKVLYEAPLVEPHRQGSWIWCRVVPARVKSLRSVLAREDPRRGCEQKQALS